MSFHASLNGLRVLLVEDEMMVSLLIEETLSEQHCAVVGPYGEFNAALRAARSEAMDFALLDVNLNGTMIFPVAETLAARKIPFLLLTGYGMHALPPAHLDWPVCSKPFRPHMLIAEILKQIDRVA